MTFFQDQLFQKKSFRNTIRVSNGLDPYQNYSSINLDLSPSFLRLQKSPLAVNPYKPSILFVGRRQTVKTRSDPAECSI